MMHVEKIVNCFCLASGKNFSGATLLNLFFVWRFLKYFMICKEFVLYSFIMQLLIVQYFFMISKNAKPYLVNALEILYFFLWSSNL